MAEGFEISDADLTAAEARGRVELVTKPRAVSARYDGKADRIVVELMNGCTFMFPPHVAQDLRDATPDQLALIEVSPAGFALHWPRIDVDFSVAGLVLGVFGTAKFMAAQAGGGEPQSIVKPPTGRANGTHGRRSRKIAT